MARVRATGAEGLLVHGLPPRVRPAYYAAAARAGQPVVSTCYASSAETVLDEAARHGPAYLYLAAQYAKADSTAPDYRTLTPVLDALRQRAQIPIAIGARPPAGLVVVPVSTHRTRTDRC